MYLIHRSVRLVIVRRFKRLAMMRWVMRVVRFLLEAADAVVKGWTFEPFVHIATRIVDPAVEALDLALYGVESLGCLAERPVDDALSIVYDFLSGLLNVNVLKDFWLRDDESRC
jgi:hypothetical protein